MSNSTPPWLFLIRVVLHGGTFVLAGFVWAWALGANLWYGIVPGAVLGLLAALIFGPTSKEERTATGLSKTGIFIARVMFVLFLLALSIVGAVVGLVIRLLS